VKEKLNIEYINPFIVGASTVFNSLLKTDLKKGKVQTVDTIDPAHDVIINIEINGAMTGFVLYSFGFHTVNKIAEALVPGLNEDAIKQEYKDIIGEVANMITGNAVTMLTDKDIVLSTPVVVDKSDFTITGLRKYIALSIKMYSPMGPLEICIVVK
jgi:chemotaxis protein CheX